MRQKNIIIGSLLGLLLLMIVGYAAFSSVLNIKGTSSISSNWNILITNVTSKNIVGSATNAEDPTWDGLTATFKTNLVSPGDSIEYDITVENRGNLNATLDKITLTDSNNPAIKFTSSGLTEGDSLNAGSNAVLTVKVEYDATVATQPESTIGTLTVTLDYSQDGGIVIQDSTFDMTEDMVNIAFPSGCGNAIKCYYILNDGEEIEVTSDSISVPRNGDIKLVTKTVYNGEEKINEYIYDTTPPEVTLNTSSTTNSVTVVANATDTASNISKYEFSFNDGPWVDNGTSNVYTVTGLTKNTTYNVKVRVTNSSNLAQEATTTATTKNLTGPTYAITSKTTNTATVTITYPEECGNGYTCTYSKDGGADVTVTGTTATVSFSQAGTLKGTITDGINTANSTYSVPISAFETYNGVVYSWTETTVNIGDPLSKIDSPSATANIRNDFIFKHTIVNSKITSTELCFAIDGTLYCLKPNDSATSKATLLNVLNCSSGTNCQFASGLYVAAYSDGSVDADDYNYDGWCIVENTGAAHCEFY